MFLFRQSMLAAISIKNVSKSFSTEGQPILAFGPADLEVNEGDFVTLLGPSGCGKSTLLLMIAGLIPCSSGQIIMNQDEILSPRHDIGMMFQDSTLVPWRSVLGNINLQLELRNLNPNDFQDKISELIESVSLKGYEHLRPHELSGGMQKRVALARAIADKPEILLFDEPTSGLDPITGGVIDNLILDSVRRLGATALTISHDMASVRRIADQVAMIHKGRVIWSGASTQMFDSGIAEVDQFVHGHAQGPLTDEAILAAKTGV